MSWQLTAEDSEYPLFKKTREIKRRKSSIKFADKYLFMREPFSSMRFAVHGAPPT